MADDWRALGACRDGETNVFFPHNAAGVVEAQRICETCPVTGACLDFALAEGLDHGVWGGYSERQRRRIAKRRRTIPGWLPAVRPLPPLAPPPPTHRELAAWLLRIPFDEACESWQDEDLVRAGTVVLAAADIGAVQPRIRMATRVPVNSVLAFSFRLRACGIWSGRNVHYPWGAELWNGSAQSRRSFLTICKVATGEMVKDGERFRPSRIMEGNGLANPASEGMPPRDTMIMGRQKSKVLLS